MRKQQQQIAIAEMCGWKSETIFTCNGIDGFETEPPNYPNDLNAMHEARRACINTLELRVNYMNTLRKIVGRRCEVNKVGTPMVSDYDCVDATAAEHSETFLRTLGKWKD